VNGPSADSLKQWRNQEEIPNARTESVTKLSSTLAPGHTETEGKEAAGTFEGGAGAFPAAKTPLARLGRVTDIAPPGMFLASDESARITGEVLRAAGGLVVAT
jgi:NAD(P)-dependent dehydrogenase (short-subunit alcohol dehydrogenase family)